MEDVRGRHLEYLRAVSNPLRRKILRALEDGETTLETLQSRTNLDGKTLEWHLDVLEHALCVEKESRDGVVFYKITKEGRVVDRLE
ncbi:winged helix-turn-helix domain-containing protein [Candidatus Bathyarchaeota archaeon]|nr:winged helix-turn-helix domain-containing protein [Candidatus Bathyarchaeota archaeon]